MTPPHPVCPMSVSDTDGHHPGLCQKLGYSLGRLSLSHLLFKSFTKSHQLYFSSNSNQSIFSSVPATPDAGWGHHLSHCIAPAPSELGLSLVMPVCSQDLAHEWHPVACPFSTYCLVLHLAELFFSLKLTRCDGGLWGKLVLHTHP